MSSLNHLNTKILRIVSTQNKKARKNGLFNESITFGELQSIM